jgi:hypothetical protein
MHFRSGLREWWSARAQIADKSRVGDEPWGIVRVIGEPLYVLMLASPTTWAYIGFGTEERRLYWLTDAYVVGALVLSIVIYFLPPNVCWASSSTFFSATTVIALLNVVLFEGVFGRKASPERSLLLFICNVAQIGVMFATWYRLSGEDSPFLTSVLTLATISHAEGTPGVAIAQIATDFLLLALFLSHLISQLGRKR